MNLPQPHDTDGIVVTATLWLIHRYRQTGCRRLARLVERHLAWMRERAARSPCLADSCTRLSFAWRAVSNAATARGAHLSELNRQGDHA